MSDKFEKESVAIIGKDGLRKHPVYNYLRRLESKNSKRGQMTSLKQAIGLALGIETADVWPRKGSNYAPEGATTVWSFNWHTLRRAEVLELKAAAVKKFAPATARCILAAVRGVMEESRFLDLMSADDFEKAWHRVRVKGGADDRVPGKYISSDEIAKLMWTCSDDSGVAGVRDAAAIGVGFNIGYRIAEAAALEFENYNPEDGSIRILGKGKKWRTAYIANGARDALENWIEFRGTLPGRMFLPIGKNGQIKHTQQLTVKDAIGRKRRKERPGQMSATSLDNMLKARQAQAGISKKFSWHDLRRTAISNLLDLGADVLLVAKLVGHASVETTARYDLRPESKKREAVQRLFVPYVKRDFVLAT